MKVALATCQTLPEADPDEAPLVAALQARGVQARLLAWDAADQRPEPDELVVVRSTWNYFEEVDRFLDWIEQTARVTRLLNPAALVSRNARKTYLRDLEVRGVAVIPTEYVTKGSPGSLERMMRERGWAKVVIKPVVSASSFRTRCFGEGEVAEGQRFLEALTLERDAMIQRWMPAVETHGERALVWIDGELTHAVRKSPRFDGGAEVVPRRVPIADDERAFAERVLEPLAGNLLYARVDVVRDAGADPGAADAAGGLLRLMELELIEPSLYLGQCADALARLTDAIVRHAREQ